MKKPMEEVPLGQLEDGEELKRRYGVFRDEVLLRWIEAVTGPHREAMIAILRERGTWKEE